MLGCAAAVAAVRLALAGAPASPDEAGYLLVAGAAHRGGVFLYGDLWVDRPPLLVLLFAAARAAGGLVALRVLGAFAAVTTVLAAASGGRRLGGARGARWAALTATALCASPLLSAPTVTGELLALPLVTACCTTALRAASAGARGARTPWWALAGALGSSAVLVKQNIVDGLVFALVLALVPTSSGGAPRGHGRSAGRLAAAGALVAGAAVPAAVALAWAAWWTGGPVHGAVGLWDAVVAFRGQSLAVIEAHSTAAPATRALRLAGEAAATGIAVVLVLFALALRRLVDRGGAVCAAAVATAATAAAGLPSIALGGSYWSHYLLELVPAVVLASSQLALAGPRLRPTTLAVVAGACAVSLVASVVVASRLDAPRPQTAAAGPACGDGLGAADVRALLARSARPGDSVALVYGGANTLVGTTLAIAYPYLWSLPVRTLDPRLSRLRAVLTGPDRATWVVEGVPAGAWGLDSGRRLRTLLRSSYRPVARLCGRTVLHRSDDVR